MLKVVAKRNDQSRFYMIDSANKLHCILINIIWKLLKINWFWNIISLDNVVNDGISVIYFDLYCVVQRLKQVLD